MKKLSKIYNALIFAFLYLPIVILIVFSFNNSVSRTNWKGFSLGWYQELFYDEAILNSLKVTLEVAVIASIVATIIGVLAAIGINAMNKKIRNTMLFVNNLPMVNPEIVTGISLMLLFVFLYRSLGLLQPGFLTLLIAHITFCIPYVVLQVMPKLRQLDVHLYEAAIDLGCHPKKAFFKVILPEIMPGVLTGSLIAFTMSLDDFVISYFTSGTSAQTLSVLIYNMTKKPITPEINALSTLLFGSILVLLIAVNFNESSDEINHHIRKKQRKKAILRFVPLVVFVISIASIAIFSNKGINDSDWDYKAEGPKAAPTGVTLNVYNWGEYIDDETLDVNEAFTYCTGIDVNYQTFENNESMYALICSGAADYDVIFPSDYMAGKMIAENMLAKLNFDNIPNFKFIDNTYKNLAYDPTNEYTVPYMWGTVGIFYNSKYVDESDMHNWDVLWNKKYAGKILMFDNPRDAFMIAQEQLGISLNSTKPKEWEQAYDLLLEQKPLLQQYVNDSVYDLMTNEEAWIAPYYAGDCSIMIYGDSGNESIKFYIPECGTNFFVDTVCVRSTTKHQQEAEAYIDFLCKAEVAKANAEYLGYATPSSQARKMLDVSISENPYFYPPQEIMEKTETYLPLSDKINKIQSDLWLKLRQ